MPVGGPDDFVCQQAGERVSCALEVGFGACQPRCDGFAVELVVVNAGYGKIVWDGKAECGSGRIDLDGARVVCRKNAAGLREGGEDLVERSAFQDGQRVPSGRTEPLELVPPFAVSEIAAFCP